jgi:hypothetical protein
MAARALATEAFSPRPLAPFSTTSDIAAAPRTMHRIRTIEPGSKPDAGSRGTFLNEWPLVALLPFMTTAPFKHRDAMSVHEAPRRLDTRSSELSIG